MKKFEKEVIHSTILSNEERYQFVWILFICYSFFDWLIDMKYYGQFDNVSEENFEVVSSSNTKINANILESSDEE